MSLFQRITITEVTKEKKKKQKSCQPFAAWTYDMEGYAQKLSRKYCELACKDVSATLCIDDHQLSPEGFNNTLRIRNKMCANYVYMRIPGLNWKPKLVMDSEPLAGT